MRAASAQRAGDRWVFAAAPVTCKLPAVARCHDGARAWFELADAVVPAGERETAIASASREALADLEAGALAVLAAVRAEREVRGMGAAR